MERLLCLLSNMNMGGAENFLMKVYRAIDRTQYQMDFCVCVEEKCDYEDEIRELGGKIFRIPPKSKDTEKFKQQLTKLIRDHHYRNVLKITSNAAGFLDLKIAKEAGAERTIARSSNSCDGSNTLHNLAHRISKVIWMKYADVKLAPSDLAAVHTFGAGAVKKGEVHFLNNGLDLGVYHFSPEARTALRKELGAGNGTPVLGHVGRFNTQKNHDFLVRFFAEYLKERPDALLALVGVGELEPQIRQLVKELDIENKVKFLGLRKDVPALMSAFDVFVFPSLYEGMPNTVIEAQACSLPCVIADTITAQANISGAVRYVPLGDVRAWNEAVGTALAAGRTEADMSAYDIQIVAEQFCRLCFGAVGE